jgi:hypothetical protein
MPPQSISGGSCGILYDSGVGGFGGNSERRFKGLLLGAFFWYNRTMKKTDGKLSRAGVSGYNKPKRTPNHPTKSHVVVAKEGGKTKTIRFGQQGVSGSPKKKGESKSSTARRKSFKARHAKNIAKGKMSAAYWANRTKW